MTATATRRPAAPAAPLAATDHLKVYHDAGSAMRLRHVLYAWAVETGTGPEKAEGVSVVGKERVLKGARLVEITYDKRRVNAGEVLTAVTAGGLGIVDVSTKEPDLEDVFLQLTRSAA